MPLEKWNLLIQLHIMKTKSFLLLLAILAGVTIAQGAFLRFVGDVNADGTISIADVKALVNIILGKSASPASDSNDYLAADVNADGSISIADVTSLVNIILGRAEASEIGATDADTLFINYTDDAVTYTLPAAWKDYVTVAVNGTTVRVSNTNVENEYVTALSGSCSNGSFTYIGSYKTTIVLMGLTLTNEQGAAMDTFVRT